MAEPRVRIRLEADSSQAVSEIGKTGTALGSLGGSVSGAVRAFTGLAAAAAALQALKSVVEASVQSEEASSRLASALRPLGEQARAVQESLEGQAQALQGITRFSDDAIVSAQAVLATFIRESDVLADATSATLDLAAAKGIDLSTAAESVSRTIGTNAQALQRYGVEAEGAAGSTERAASVIRQLREETGGAAAAAVKTFAGEMERLKNAAGSLLSNIGGVVTGSSILRSAMATTTTILQVASASVADFKSELGLAEEKLAASAAATRKLSGEYERLAKSTVGAQTATERLIELLGGVSSIQLETKAFELEAALVFAFEEAQLPAEELRIKAAEVEEQVASLRAEAERLRQGLPQVGEAAQVGLGVATESAAEFTEQMAAARSGTESVRLGFSALGAQADQTASRVAQLGAQLMTVAAAGGGSSGAFGLDENTGRLLQRQGVLSNIGITNGRVTSGNLVIRDSLGRRTGSRLIRPSGGTFGIQRAPSFVSSDGRVLF